MPDRLREDAETLLEESVSVDDFVTWTEWSLARVGFRPSNCLPLVDVCRDELMAGFVESVARTWGRPFEIGSLAGLVFLGRTGVSAALSHVPGEDGRHRFVVFCFPHIGIERSGSIGQVQRRGMSRASTACGALAAFRAQLLDGARHFELDATDVEQSLLRMRLSRMLVPTKVPTLLELTDMARRAATSDVRTFIDLARGAEPVDVAYLSGILMHVPDGTDRVTRVFGRVEIDDMVLDLPH